MGNAPVSGGRISEETLLNLVIDSSSRHFIQGPVDDGQHFFLTNIAVAEKRIFQGVRIGKLGLETEASIVDVEIDSYRSSNVPSNSLCQRLAGSLGERSRLELAACLALALCVVVEHGAQDFPQLLRRNVCSTGDYLPLAIKECGRGPSAHVVPAVHIGPFVSVDSDRDEVFADGINYDRV